MDAVDLLNSDLADLPRTKQDGTYGARLRLAFDSYADEVKLLKATDYASQEILAAQSRIRDLSDRLLNIHQAALKGRFDTARTEMKEALETVNEEFSVFKSHPLNQKALGCVFRLRTAAPSEKVDRGGIFHIPFDLRHLVTPRRYSLAGLPMLYVGSTLFVCWEELGRPSFDGLWVAAMRLKKDVEIRVLNFGYRPALLAALLEEEHSANTPRSHIAIAHAILWPIIAACSFPKKFENAPFAEEYVLPQLVIAQVIEDGDFDGIRYFSNRIHGYGGEFLTQNFVFPSQPLTAEGYCPKLSNMFEVTPPMPLSMVELLGKPVEYEESTMRSKQGHLEVYSGHRVAYQNTGFAKIEDVLMSQSFEPIV